MAAKKKAARVRREPAFDEDDDGPELRVTAGDRAAPASDGASPAKPRKRRARKKRPARGIGARFGRDRLLGPGRRPVARHRLRRRHHLGRRTSAADPVAGNSEAAAFDPDRRHAGARARAPRRSRRRAVAAAGNAELRAEGIHRHRGPPLSTNTTASTRSASGAPSSPTSCTAPSRKAARPSRSSSPRISS